LPSYSRKERIKDQLFFDNWKPLLEDIQDVQKTTSKACRRLWNSSDDFFEEIGMQLIPSIDEATLAKVRVTKVEEHKEISRMNIEHLTDLNKESMEEHLLRPIRLITMTRDFIKRTTQELKQ
jgi:hypothetical protein